MVKHIENLAIARKLEPFYDKSAFGAQLSEDGAQLFCKNGASVNVLDVATGTVLREVGVQEDEVNCFVVVDRDDESNAGQPLRRVITAHKSLLIREWNVADGKLVRTWTSQHRLPILRITVDSTRTLIATASADSTAKCYDIVKQFLTHNCKPHSGAVRLVVFAPDTQTLFTADDASTLRAFDLATRTVRWSVEAAHVSAITALSFSADAHHFVTAGRDRVLTVWRVSEKDSDADWIRKERTVPVFESLESAFFVERPEIEHLLEEPERSNKRSDTLYCVTAGESGAMRLFDLSTMHCIQTWNAAASQSQLTEQSQQVAKATDYYSIHSVAYTQQCDSYVLVARVNGTLELRERYDAAQRFTLRTARQFAGCVHEEVLDLAFVNERLLAIATDSDELRVVDVRSNESRLVRAHNDAILALATSRLDATRSLLATASRDSTVNVWLVEHTADSFEVRLVANASGHTDHVTSVAFSHSCELNASGDEAFLVSVASDCFIKMWKLADFLKSLLEGESPKRKRKRSESETISEKAPSAVAKLDSRLTVKVHEKRINSVAVSPNVAYLATASQDRLVRIFDTRSLSCVGSLPHRKAVSSVRFSRDEAVLVTACADRVIRLFEARAPFACRCTLEGHGGGVLQTIFVNRSRQLLSTGCDGLLKLWNLADRECVRTLDDHAGRVWALAVRESPEADAKVTEEQSDPAKPDAASALLKDGGLLVASGDSDSSIIIWADVTTQERNAERTRQAERVVQDQTLRNLLVEHRHVEAVRLCLSLGRKLELYNIFAELLTDSEIKDNQQSVFNACLRDVHGDEISRLLTFVSDWNTQPRSCVVAQRVASAILRSRPMDELLALDRFERFVEAFVPYSDRHLARLDRLQQSVAFLEFAAYSMRAAPTSQITATANDTEMASPSKQVRVDADSNVAHAPLALHAS